MWSESVITTAGLPVVHAYMRGEDLTITQVVAGAGVSADPRKLTALKDPRQTLPVLTTVETDHGIRITVRCENSALAEGYDMRQVGIYGQTETAGPALLFVLQDMTGIRVPGTDEMPDFLFDFSVRIEASSEAEIRASVESSEYPYEIEKFRHLDTTCIIVSVPRVNTDGTRNVWRLGFANDQVGRKNDGWVDGGTLPTGTRETTHDFARRHRLPLVSNGGYFNMPNTTAQKAAADGSLGWWPDGITIKDGAKICVEPYKYATQQTLAVMEDGTFRYYDNAPFMEMTDEELAEAIDDMIADGVRQTLTAHAGIIHEGEIVTGMVSSQLSFWQAIGYDDVNYYLFSSAGFWGDEEAGFTKAQLAELLGPDGRGWTECYVLDSGGSTSTALLTAKLGKNKDESGGVDRKVGTFLYLDRESARPMQSSGLAMAAGSILASYHDDITRLERVLRKSSSGIGEYLEFEDDVGQTVTYDINDATFRTAGVWHIRNATEAAKVAHLPVAVGGRLETVYMTGPTFAIQRFYPRQSVYHDRVCFMRRYDGTQAADARWSRWILQGGQFYGQYKARVNSGSPMVEILGGGYAVSELMATVTVRIKALRDITPSDAGNGELVLNLATDDPIYTSNTLRAVSDAGSPPLAAINETTGQLILACSATTGGIRIGACSANDIIRISGAYVTTRNYTPEGIVPEVTEG